MVHMYAQSVLTMQMALPVYDIIHITNLKSILTIRKNTYSTTSLHACANDSSNIRDYSE